MSDFDPNRTLANTPSSSGRLGSSFSSSTSGLMSLMNPLPPPEQTSRYAHLPTPQSPTHNTMTFNQYMLPHTPDTPTNSGMRPPARKEPGPATPRAMGMMTPESSPFVSRLAPPYSASNLPRTPTSRPPPYVSATYLTVAVLMPFSAKPIRGSPMHVDDVFSVSNAKIRHAMAQEQKEVEKRRPEYLKRSKRPLEDGEEGSAESSVVGIMESPNKGRRLKLFQETSEESFEESLMAGGYGRYRTADWVRQPQPMLVAPEVSVLEAEEPPPLTEKELKKRKRLEAFRSENQLHHGPSRLFPVELEGKGRVLLDIPNESLVPEGGKRRNGGSSSRRKKKDGEKERSAGIEMEDSPNWPDSEFPWRLRTEERAELARAEEKERLGWIERFLDRDTDDEGDGEGDGDGEWRCQCRARRGRGKMIGLPADPVGERRRRRTLLSKRSVRALEYRREKRLRGGDSDDEVVCICRGTDDGRELMWYHLECIGIRSIRDLGREEGSLGTAAIVSCRLTLSGKEEEEEEIYREPTFAPTDMDYAPRRRGYDAIFAAGAIEDSPASLHLIPTSTPSRGIKFSGPFATPKNTMWGRGAGPFYTPVRLDDSPVRRHE
ncbi:uncharacterized protein EV420DRAFT_1573523 [Desarmillaria tabescens]|uniref:Zinc finger PHD-type domain-containing protein n=1 Tax=Armillaria tabescens TaxID=1929756 RepID=A0AA39JNG5_ARMTA|nr:uncharacterized protein EV420DRAFT_1573523 [Desarmillaria tabescens]KAK0444941.1 hypothetical protein EV420DRAFT_1573523 [Desarmillaria tabescens]